MQNFFEEIFKPRPNYRPLIEVRIFKNSLIGNLNEFRKAYPTLEFAPVLKSNAYGHGLMPVAKILDRQECPFFMVDSFYEALTLRQHGVKTKILILGYNRTEQILNNKLRNCSLGIIDLKQLKNIASQLTKPQTFHLKIDTGMHRQGILIEQIKEAIELIKSNSNFILEGVCSHFADSDGQDQSFTLEQIKKWNEIVRQFKKDFSSVKYFHTSNTAGNIFAQKIDANVSRLGIGLYGINPEEASKLKLQPALEMVSLISSIKNIPAGEKVGYGMTFTSTSPMKIATVPVGYNEGLDRRLSNRGVFKINGIFCPLVGRVSMNMSSIDVSGIKDVNLEQEVVVISRYKQDKNSLENTAKLCECISHEILVKIPSGLRRVIK